MAISKVFSGYHIRVPGGSGLPPDPKDTQYKKRTGVLFEDALQLTAALRALNHLFDVFTYLQTRQWVENMDSDRLSNHTVRYEFAYVIKTSDL